MALAWHSMLLINSYNLKAWIICKGGRNRAGKANTRLSMCEVNGGQSAAESRGDDSKIKLELCE